MSKHRTGEVECLARYPGRRGTALLRPVLLAIFGALAWLVWLAGPSEAATTDVLPTVPAVPSVPAVPTIPLPAVSLPPAPLPASVGQLVDDVPSAVPSPSQLAAVPKTVVNQLPGSAVTPVLVGIIDTVPPLVDNTLSELPTLPALPSVLALPPVSGILPPPELGLPLGAVHAPSALGGPGAPGRRLGFVPDRPIPMSPAVLSITGASMGAGDPPHGKPFPPAATPNEAGSTPEPQGGSAHGEAGLPEQRALAPPFRNGPIPDSPQAPATEPAFDPGSSPD